VKPAVPLGNPETVFVPGPPENEETPSAAVADVPEVAVDGKEKVGNEEGWVIGAVVLAELVAKKPGLVYAAEPVNVVDDNDETATPVVRV